MEIKSRQDGDLYFVLCSGFWHDGIHRQNHHENKVRFVEGKHFFKVEGESLRELKHRVALNYSVKIARNVRSLTLWTERGAARHAKMLETD